MRRPRAEPGEFAMQRPARAQQFDRIVARADNAQIQRSGLRLEAGQVAGDQGRQRTGLTLRQRIAARSASRHPLQRERAENVNGGLAHDRCVIGRARRRR